MQCNAAKLPKNSLSRPTIKFLFLTILPQGKIGGSHTFLRGPQGSQALSQAVYGGTSSFFGSSKKYT